MARAREAPLLIVSAFAPELAPLVAWLAAPRQRALRAGVVCRSAGVGAVDAAAGAAQAIAQVRPRLVLFVGTAGRYGAMPPIGACAVARRIYLAPTAVLRGEAYLPGPMQHELTTDAALRRALRGAGHTPAADVATTLGITSRRALATRLAATGAALENLEAFAVARAAARAELPFGAVLGVANSVGPQAHREWRANASAATAAACAVIQQWLARADRSTAREKTAKTSPVRAPTSAPLRSRPRASARPPGRA
jgi:nucleoside phosphorylase